MLIFVLYNKKRNNNKIKIFFKLLFLSWGFYMIGQHEQLMQKARIPGMQVASIAIDDQDGKTCVTSKTESFGVANEKTQEKVTDNTLFEACSLSKPVFAYLVLQLISKGVIKDFNLDTPLYTMWQHPALVNDERAKKLTARAILSHQSGLDYWPISMLDPKSILDSGNKQQLQLGFIAKPQTDFCYSSIAYHYLQEVIERTTKKTLEELAQQYVFEPLKMLNSSYTIPNNKHLATGHNENGVLEQIPIKNQSCAGSLRTTAEDYIKFVEYLLKNKNDETIKQLFNPLTQVTDPNISWGLGWGIQNSQERVVFHWGNNDSFKAFVAINLTTNKASVCFFNGANGLAIAEEIIAPTVGNIKPLGAWVHNTCGVLFTELEYGKAMLRQGNFAAAKEIFTHILEKQPDDIYVVVRKILKTLVKKHHQKLLSITNCIPAFNQQQTNTTDQDIQNPIPFLTSTYCQRLHDETTLFTPFLDSLIHKLEPQQQKELAPMLQKKQCICTALVQLQYSDLSHNISAEQKHNPTANPTNTDCNNSSLLASSSAQIPLQTNCEQQNIKGINEPHEQSDAKAISNVGIFSLNPTANSTKPNNAPGDTPGGTVVHTR
jgi:CubicO group peptidase (beta-lactamase class C family)